MLTEGAFACPWQLCGTWVWILVAATSVSLPLQQGWVMYVSITSCLISLLLLLSYIFGFHRNSNNWKVLVRMGSERGRWCGQQQLVPAAGEGLASPLQANVLFLLSSLGIRPGLYWKRLGEVLLCHCYVWPLFNGRVKGKGSGCARSRSHLHPHEHGPGAGPCASPWEMGSIRCHQEVRCAAECPGVPVPFVLLYTEDGRWHLLALGQERDKQGRAVFDPQHSLVLQDSLYHGATAILYMSAAVLQANATIASEFENGFPLYYYQLNCAASVSQS